MERNRTASAGEWAARSNGCERRWSGFLAGIIMSVVALGWGTVTLRAETITLPNGSFELPVTPFADPSIGSWQKSPKPAWYDESGGHLWDQLTGVFKNTAPTNAAYIDNMAGDQAAFLFALPLVAVFQDYNSTEGTNATRTHAFNAKFEVGKAYTLTVGVIGGGGGMTNGVTLELILYYRDSASNMVTVAATSITNSPDVFSNLTHFIDFSVRVPTVKAGDPWAGQNMGVQLLSTVSPDLVGGYWDVDNVRLAETIAVPNGSFELPVTPFADPSIDSWQKSPKPAWYDESGGHLWDQLTGVFKNTALTNASYIDNMAGDQAAFLFALPQVAVFQDYNSTEGTNATPTHAFNAKFEVGKAYTLTVGVIGGGGGMTNGVTLELILYYRDSASNMVTVAATSITNSPDVFSNLTHFIDFSVRVPTVKAGDAWAGQNLGVQLLSTVSPDLVGGYWDVDNVRLAEVPPAALLGVARTNEGIEITLQSDPGRRFEILAAGDITLPIASWTSLATLTNSAGAISFLDSSTNANVRFYRARQLP